MTDADPAGRTSSGDVPTARAGAAAPPGRCARVLAALFLSVGVAFGIGLVQLWWIDPEAPTLHRDWTAFHRVGTHAVQGTWSRLYELPAGDRYPYLYPPWTAWWLAPLGLLPPGSAHGVCLLASATALLCALTLLRRLVPGDPGAWAVAVACVLGSPPWLGVLLTGQLSAGWLLLIVAGGWCWCTGRRRLAGFCFGLLALKPNLPGPFLLAALARRDGQVLIGMASAVLLLALSTGPMGANVWAEFFTQAPVQALQGRSDPVLLPRQQTLFACGQVLLGTWLPAPMLQVLWVLAVAALLVLTWRAARHEPAHGWRGRWLGLLTLVDVACNPYLYFYDALLLAIPAVAWWMGRDTYGSRLRARACGGLLAFIVGWQMVGLLLWPGLPPLVGAAVAAWTAIEAWDLATAASRSS